MLLLLLAFALSFLLSLYGTPLAAAAARRFGIVDRPDGRLKVHSEPVPYLGGLAIYVAFLLSYGVVFDYEPRILGLLLSANIVVTLGLLDDFGAITPKVKFLGQLLAAFVLVRSGIVIELAFLPPWLNAALTILWVIGMMNALNIIDIMDGLAGGTALVAAAVFMCISVLTNTALMSFVAVTLLGSLLGFLRHNYHPASIYMGDTGSMFLGLVLATFALVADYSDRNPLGFLSPLFILCVPLFDMAYVSLLRTLKGRPFYFGSKDHYALRLHGKWPSVPAVVNVSCLVGVAGGMLGIANMFASPRTSLVMLGGMLVFFSGVGVWLAGERGDEGA